MSIPPTKPTGMPRPPQPTAAPTRTRYFLVADEHEMQRMPARDGDYASIAGWPGYFICENQAWRQVRTIEMFDALAFGDVVIAPSSQWTQPPRSLSQLAATVSIGAPPADAISVPMRRDAGVRGCLPRPYRQSPSRPATPPPPPPSAPTNTQTPAQQGDSAPAQGNKEDK